MATCARAQSRISSVSASWPVIRARIAFSTGLLGKGGGARRSSAAHLTRFQPPVEWGPASAKHSTLGRIEGEVGRPGGHGGRRSREVPGIALRSRQMRVQAFQPSALVTGSCPKRRPRRSAESAPRRSECWSLMHRSWCLVDDLPQVNAPRHAHASWARLRFVHQLHCSLRSINVS